MVPEVPGPGPLDESDRRQVMFDALAQAILAPARPLLLVADDLHWTDQETLQFLHYLLRVGSTAPLLVAATARREDIDDQHPLNDLLIALRASERLTEIELGRLSRHETNALAEQFVGGPLEGSESDRLFAETEGNPLFVVEALRAAGTQSDGKRGRLSPKVQAVIESRLAQLTQPARDLVGIAATIGREFTIDVLAEAGHVDEESLVRGLDQLWQRRIVRDQGPDAYDFTHDRIREVAYLALSPPRRRRAHKLVARALERLHFDDTAPVAAQLGAHYEQAGEFDRAVVWYERGAEIAQQLYANAEAARLLERALQLIRSRPENHENRVRELAILNALTAPLVTVEGLSSDRLTKMHERGLELARELGVEPGHPFLRSLAMGRLTRGDFAGAKRTGEQLRASGERDDDGVRVVEGNYVLGIAAFWSGEFLTAQKHFEAAVNHYRSEHRRLHLLMYAVDPKVMCLGRLANTLWFLGRPKSAARARDATLALAAEIGHPYTQETALLFAAVLALDMRDSDRLREHVRYLTAERSEHEARHTRTGADAFLGYVAVLDGNGPAGIARIERTLPEIDGIEFAPGLRAVLMRLLLEACATTGDARRGIAVADRALSIGGAARVWESEAHRPRAEFLASLDASNSEVDAEFEHAIRVARLQGAKMLELRAATSMLRHRLEGRNRVGSSQARERLTAIVDSLPEARTTKDVREAAALLARS